MPCSRRDAGRGRGCLFTFLLSSLSKATQTAATLPSDPSPLSEAEGKGAAVLPIIWMPE